MEQVAKNNEDREFEFTDKDFKFLVKLVTDNTGIVLADHKKNMVYSRLVRRIRLLGLNSFKEYCDLLSSGNDSSEFMNFVNAITTNLTSFFREPHHFDHLRQLFITMAKGPPKDKRIRILSAGCSQGMEAYSISMVLSSIIDLAGWDAKILATDIDTGVLEKGRNGIYRKEEAEKIPAPYKDKFISLIDKENFQVSEKLRSLVHFKQLNLLHNWPVKGPFDIIFCRNTVIYFDKPTQKIIFNKFADLMKENAWLYIGHSENLFNVSDRFKLLGRTIYQRVK